MNKLKNMESNYVFDILIDTFKETHGYEKGEPMDGDATEGMSEWYAAERGWGDEEKREFLNYADIREGNVNPDDYRDINLNEMKDEKDRMRKLTQAFQQKGEIFKEERDNTNAEKIQEEFKRLSELASGEKTASLKEAEQGGFMGGNDTTGGFHGTNQPRSVTSIIDNLYDNPTMYQGAQGNAISLKDDEALGVAIKRTLESGAPVNNIAFYDEVNWHLAQLGFPSKLPQDIKSAILKMITG